MSSRTILWIILLSLCSSITQAEPETELRFIAGTSAFLDEDIPFDHSIFGGSVGVHLTERLRIEPQFLYMQGPGNDSDYVISGNVSYDLIEKEGLELYIVGGGGFLYNRNQFGTGPAFSSTEWIANGGVGFKLNVSKRIFIAPEFRLGYEPLFLATVSVGYKF